MCAARAPRSEGHLLTKVVMAQQFNLTEVLDAACHGFMGRCQVGGRDIPCRPENLLFE